MVKLQKELKNQLLKNINHINYKETLFSKQQMHHKMKTIRSNCHEISSYKINKVSLSCFDDKRYSLNDGIKNYAYGHKIFCNIHETNRKIS